MELDDNEFDAAFRERVFDADPEFEEAAWNKMEGKLKRRDRIVLFRKVAGTLSALILLGLIGYYSFDLGAVKKTGPQLVQQKEVKGEKGTVKEKHGELNGKQGNLKEQQDKIKGEPAQLAGQRNTDTTVTIVENRILGDSAVTGAQKAGAVKGFAVRKGLSKATNLPALAGSGISTAAPLRTEAQVLQLKTTVPGPVLAINAKDKTRSGAENNQEVTGGGQHEPVTKLKEMEKKKPILKRPVPMSLAFTAGPEFNSANTLIGGKTGFNAGLSFSVGIAKKMKLETGLKYSRKDYATDGYAYRLWSPNVQQMVTNIDAACAVLEIPIRASYTVLEDFQRSIDLNLGLSSYLMLKEDYTFRYIPSAGMADRLLEKVNANQHFLSVVDVSATYYIRLKSEKFKVGVEPFVKIPLTGIGEGRMNLKSSGISLKIRYDLDKKR